MFIVFSSVFPIQKLKSTNGRHLCVFCLLTYYQQLKQYLSHNKRSKIIWGMNEWFFKISLLINQSDNAEPLIS